MATVFDVETATAGAWCLDPDMQLTEPQTASFARRKTFGADDFYVEGDITMVPLLTHTTFTDVGSGDVDIAGPVAIDGLHFKEFRLVAYVMTHGNTAKIRMMGLDTNGITWTDLGDTTGLLWPNLVDLTYSEWTPIASNFWWPTTAKAVIYDGDGTEDVELGALVLHLRR